VQKNSLELPLALPPILEMLSWIVGRWETSTMSGMRFPLPLASGYRETLHVQISDAPMFDRPALNVSVYANTFDGSEKPTEVGFMTIKPFKEDTGFVEFDKPEIGDDKVAIEMVGNNGIATIEEGIIKGTSMRLTVKHKMITQWQSFRAATRTFHLLNGDTLEERVTYEDDHGRVSRFLKRYRRTYDYLGDF
jgi:hypothetical protein